MSLFSGEFVSVADGSKAGGLKIMNADHLDIQLSAASVTGQVIFIPPVGYTIAAVREVHAVAGGAGATVNIERLTGTQAPGSGAAILTAPIVLTGAANTVQSTALTNIVATAASLNALDRLAVVLAGTLTGLANCTLQVSLVKT
jgi:hypothetical protein